MEGNHLKEQFVPYYQKGINIDECRIELSEGDDPRLGGIRVHLRQNKLLFTLWVIIEYLQLGRYPGMMDGSEEVLEGFPYTKSGKMKQHIKGGI